MLCQQSKKINIVYTVKNLKIINKKRLLDNLSLFSHKKVCAMVKADAYGHGMRQIAEILQDKVFCFGVAKVEEGAVLRSFCKTPIVVVGKTFDFDCARKNNLIVVIESEAEAKMAIKFGLSVFVKIDCGMKRLGVNSAKTLKKIVAKFDCCKKLLLGFSVHFSNTASKESTQKQYQKFLRFKKLLPKGKLISFGGSGFVDYDFEFDIIRVGLGLYGYQSEMAKPVMKIVSFVEKVFVARKGDWLGYGNKFQVPKTGKFALVPVGYADGLQRGLTGQKLLANDKECEIVGNVCMDVCFVQVDNSVSVGDRVVVVQDATAFANQLGTIEYEILTNFSRFRGEVVVE